MDQFNYAEIKETLPEVMEKVCHDHTPIIITRDNNPAVVLMSLDDYSSYQETLYLLKSPKNAQRLRESIIVILVTFRSPLQECLFPIA